MSTNNIIDLAAQNEAFRIDEPENVAVSVEEAAVAEENARRDFVRNAVADWVRSPRFQDMKTGQRYFENRTDILERKKQVIGRNGEMVDAPYLANNRLPHAFMRKLTKQKIGYLLSKPFSVVCDDVDFQGLVTKEYITPEFYRVFKSTGQDAVVAGIGWLQVFYDAQGRLSFSRIPPTEIIPFWADIDHTQLQMAIRVWDVAVAGVNAEKEIRRFAQLFTPQGIFNYIIDDETITPGPIPQEPNFSLNVNGEAVGMMWARIPLIPFKYNTEEDSLLKYIKELIDDYDLRTSDLSNTLQDEPDRIKIVKDYDGTDKGDFVYNLARFRTVFLRDTGSVETLDTHITPDAIENHLDRLRKDIYEFGGGVDTQTKDLGNASGVALKFIYSDLDMDCADFGNELAFSFERIVMFIKDDLQLKGRGEYYDRQVRVEFNTDVAINESETIENISRSVGIVSTETLLAQHPYVSNVREEMKTLEAEAEAEAERAVSVGFSGIGNENENENENERENA